MLTACTYALREEDIVYAHDLTSSTLSTHEKEALSNQLGRTAAADVSNVETHPVPDAAKTVSGGDALAAGKVLQLGQKLEGMCMAVSEDASYIAVGSRNGQVLVSAWGWGGLAWSTASTDVSNHISQASNWQTDTYKQ